MNKILKRYSLLTVCWIAVVIMWQLDWEHKDAPAWVQAIGSVLAILAAVGLSMNQHRNDLKRDALNERAAVNRLLIGLRDEIAITMQAFQLSAGQDIAKSNLRKGVQIVFYPSDRPFKIYNSNVDKIGIIPEDDLRQSIIAAYSRFELFLVLMTMNNDYIEHYNARQNLPRPTVGILTVEYARQQQKIDAAERQFVDHGDKIIQAYSECLTCADDLLAKLDASIESRRRYRN